MEPRQASMEDMSGRRSTAGSYFTTSSTVADAIRAIDNERTRSSIMLSERGVRNACHQGVFDENGPAIRHLVLDQK